MSAIPKSPLYTAQRLGLMGCVAAIYFLAAVFGLSLATLSRQVSPVWPPAGIALAALLILGAWVWPGIALGAFAINALTGPIPAALGIAAGNTLEAALGAILLRRYAAFHWAMDRPRDVLALVLCSAVVSAAIAASVGVASLCLTESEPWSQYARLWWTWWLGDAMGVLVVAPPLLIGAAWLRGRQPLRRPIESVIFVVTAAVLSYLVLGGTLGSPLVVKFLVFPLFVWSSLRLGQLCNAAGLVLASGFALFWILSTAPAAKVSAYNATLLHMQTFLGVLAMVSYMLGAVVAERERISGERDALLQSEQAARLEAERMARQKDDFVATLSHELRTPLNGLLGWTQVLRRGAGGPQVVSEGLASIERCGRTLAQLLNDLLDMTRVISGKMNLRFQPVDLEGTIDHSLDMVRPEATAKGIELVKDVQTHPRVSGDTVRLQQALVNLLSNAVKFTPSGGTVSVELGRHGANAVVKIRDTGLGIKPDLVPLIFERFRQADSSTTRRFGGLGLGLAIVKHIVQLHGGSVEAESGGAGQGATFTIRIPQAAEATIGTSEPGAEHNGLSGMTILIVEDDHDACELLRRILSEFGAQVYTATNAQQAWGLLSHRPQLLLSDIGLPDMDGYQLMRRVREHPDPAIRDVSAIALTAFTREQDRERAFEAGFDDHVPKPLDVSALLIAVDRVRAAPRSVLSP